MSLPFPSRLVMETAPRLEHVDNPAPAVDTAHLKTALVTGSSGGIGLALAQALAARGWRVLLHGRDPDKLNRARTRLGVGTPHDALRADLADPQAIRQLAEGVRERTDRLDALVHNAGLLRPSLERTAAGVEVTMAVNALAPFVLTEALRPLLAATAREHGGARVVAVSSVTQQRGRIPTTDPVRLAHALRGPTDPERYSSLRAYANSKLVETVWTLELARRLAGTGVTANACDPGIVRTDVFKGVGGVLGAVSQLFTPFYLSPGAGAKSPLVLATDPVYATETGRWITRGYLRGPHQAAPPAAARDPETGAAVWDALGALADGSGGP